MVLALGTVHTRVNHRFRKAQGLTFSGGPHFFWCTKEVYQKNEKTTKKTKSRSRWLPPNRLLPRCTTCCAWNSWAAKAATPQCGTCRATTPTASWRVEPRRGRRFWGRRRKRRRVFFFFFLRRNQLAKPGQNRCGGVLTALVQKASGAPETNLEKQSKQLALLGGVLSGRQKATANPHHAHCQLIPFGWKLKKKVWTNQKTSKLQGWQPG